MADSLTAFVRASLAPFADRTALIDGPSGRSYTYARLLELSASVANELVARGVAPGDRVALVTPNVPEAACVYHGIIMAGAVAMMINPLSTPSELAKYASIGTPKLAVTVAPLADGIKTGVPALPVVVMTELLGASTTFADVPRKSDDIAVMPFSSGTTGFPKGVMLTHGNMIAQCRSLAASDPGVVLPDSNVLAVLPFFHIYGIMAFLTYGLTRGATIVTMPRFDLEQYLALARQYEIPLLHVVPPILLALAKYPGELALPHMKTALTGAAPLSAELADAFTKRTGAAVYQVYGMTEVAGASHLGSPLPGKNKPGSIGRVIPDVESRIVDGEIWVRGPAIMKGYFENAKETAETIDGDGWLHTGDVGYVDDDGDYFVVDRVKELIKYKGLQVAPAELEAVLLQHDAVADAAVYGVPDAEAGEIPKAAIVLKQGATTTVEDLLSFVQSRVNPQKRVRAIRLVAQIPKSASGKILRRVLLAEETS